MANPFEFPFSPSAPDTLNPISDPETPQSPTPATLPIKTNPFNYLVARKPAPSATHTPQTASAPEMASPTQAAFNLFDIDPSMTFPQMPPRIHDRAEVWTPTPFERANGQNNPFSDEHELTPLKPWMKIERRRRRESRLSESSSSNSSRTFHTAGPVNYSHPRTPTPTLRSSPSLARSSSYRTQSRFTKDPFYSLGREVRVREASKAQDRRLQLERARDEVRRLDPSTPTSRLHLPPVKSFNARSKDYKDPVPSLLKNDFFWCALLLTQTGFVSTGAAFAILMKDRKNGFGAGTVFWLVCSVCAWVIGILGTMVMCARKGNACLGTQDKMGFNEIQDLSAIDLERGQSGGGGLLYLGVGDRDEGSALGGGSLKSDGASVRFVRGSEGRAGEWVVGNGRDSMESSLKDPMWKDLYLTPSALRVSSSLGPSIRSKSRFDGEVEDPDLSAQRLKPTPTIVRVSDDGESSTGTRVREEVVGLGFDTEDNGGGSDYHSILPSAKSSLVLVASTLNNWTATIEQEVHTWSPLTRLERVLSEDVPTLGAKPIKEKKFDDEQGIELTDISVPYEKLEDTKPEDKKGKGKAMTLVGEQVAEYHGYWSSEIIQQRMKQRRLEKEEKCLKQLQAEKSKVEGVSVRERAKQFEDQASHEVEDKKAYNAGVFVVGDDSED